MLTTEMLHNRRIDRGRDLLRPRVDVPEIARAQEVDIQRILLPARLLLMSSFLEETLSTPFQLRLRILDLLLDARRLEHLVEVLHADIAARARRAGRVVGPDVRVDAPAFAVPFLLQRVVELEASDQDDFAARFAEGRHAGLREPLLEVGVVVFQDAGELLVGAVACAFAFDAED